MNLLPHIILVSVTLIVGISISWTEKRGAPWVPTPMKTVHTMLTMADVGPGDVVYDLGCGDGRLITTAARHYGARAVGVELDPLRYIWCQALITVLGLRDQVKIIHGDLFKQDYSRADVIICYLLQDTNNKLEAKLKTELPSGTRIVSNTFDFTGIQLVRRDDQARLYVI